LVIDETSMVDVMLMQALVKRAGQCALLIVGTSTSSPRRPDSVGRFIRRARAVVRLTEAFGSRRERIIVNAHRFNQGSCRISTRPRDSGSTSCRPMIQTAVRGS